MGGSARGCKHQNEHNLYIPTHVYDFGSRNSTLRHSTFSSRFPAVRGLGKQFPAVRGLGVHVTELGVRESAFPTALKHKVSTVTLEGRCSKEVFETALPPLAETGFAAPASAVLSPGRRRCWRRVSRRRWRRAEKPRRGALHIL